MYVGLRTREESLSWTIWQVLSCWSENSGWWIFFVDVHVSVADPSRCIRFVWFIAYSPVHQSAKSSAWIPLVRSGEISLIELVTNLFLWALLAQHHILVTSSIHLSLLCVCAGTTLSTAAYSLWCLCVCIEIDTETTLPHFAKDHLQINEIRKNHFLGLKGLIIWPKPACSGTRILSEFRYHWKR